MDGFKNSLKPANTVLNCRGRVLPLESPVVMGILNVTPDSFYDGNLFSAVDQFVARARKMLDDGATILDVGGQSTRPGSERINAVEESSRVVPVIRAIAESCPQAFISVDTFQSEVAVAAVEAGACIVNDVSAGMLDTRMIPAVAQLRVPYVIMHMKGNPGNMQELAVYRDLLLEVTDYFISRVDVCRKAGIKDLIIDPGFGFAKNIAQNFELLGKMQSLQCLGLPVMAGLSRKSTIYKTLGITADEALNGTTVLNTIALLKGASILRVHDVKEAVEAVRMVNELAVSS